MPDDRFLHATRRRERRARLAVTVVAATVATIPRTPVSTESFELPATGGDTSGTLAIGAVLVAAGSAAALIARRRAS